MEELRAYLEEHGQGHVFEAFPDLTADSNLAKQLQSYDIPLVLANYKKAKVQSNNTASVIPVKQVYNTEDPIRRNHWESLGNDAILKSKVATVILSGGQGTRLGFDGPKGMYDIGLPSKKTIFEIHIEKVNKIRRLVAEKFRSSDIPSIPIYIMTSDLNDKIIKDFFLENEYFGYPHEDIYFFEQGLEPCLSLEGKIIIESPSTMALSPDGNGGIYSALASTGALADMERRGIEHLHVYGIDNVLTKAADPLFLGVCIADGAQCGNKIVWRANEAEKVGVTVELEGKMMVIEYSEIPKSLAEAVDTTTGKLLFGAANICNHYFSFAFVKELIPNLARIYHLAEKKIPFYNPESKCTVLPEKVNGLKLEMFIFDVFPFADRWVVFEVNREDEFAPVKNASGSAADSPDTARFLISSQGKRWLKAAGAVFSNEGSIVVDDACEVSASESYFGEGLEKYAGKDIQLPFCSTGFPF